MTSNTEERAYLDARLTALTARYAAPSQWSVDEGEDIFDQFMTITLEGYRVEVFEWNGCQWTITRPDQTLPSTRWTTLSVVQRGAEPLQPSGKA